MKPKIDSIRYKNGYTYQITFSDNTKGDVNFTEFLWGEAFQELKDKNFFKQAAIDRTSGTIVWPNGIDIAPDIIYRQLIS